MNKMHGSPELLAATAVELIKGAGIPQDELKERIVSSTDKDCSHY